MLLVMHVFGMMYHTDVLLIQHKYSVSGLVTGALKTKRKSIQERYKTVVDNLFASI